MLSVWFVIVAIEVMNGKFTACMFLQYLLLTKQLLRMIKNDFVLFILMCVKEIRSAFLIIILWMYLLALIEDTAAFCDDDIIGCVLIMPT